MFLYFQKSNVEMLSRKENVTDGKAVENVGKIGLKPDAQRHATNVRYFCDLLASIIQL